jgi:RNA-binding proteins (RRM domain)
MDFAIGEEVIRETLASAGTIEEVRLVKNFKGLSKGYAFVVFSKQVSVCLCVCSVNR